MPISHYSRAAYSLSAAILFLFLWIPTNNAPKYFFLLLGSPALLAATYGLRSFWKSIDSKEKRPWMYVLLVPLALAGTSVFLYAGVGMWELTRSR